jgi:hypothetical protein
VCSQIDAPAALSPEKELPVPTEYVAGEGPRDGLDDMEEKKFLTLQVLQLRLPGGLAHTQSLYRLCYPSSRFTAKTNKYACSCFQHIMTKTKPSASCHQNGSVAYTNGGKTNPFSYTTFQALNLHLSADDRLSSIKHK